MSFLEVNDLYVGFNINNEIIEIISGVSFTIEKQTILGLAGESGCGKSLIALSLMGLLPKPHGLVISGSIMFNNIDLTKKNAHQQHAVRGRSISMIFQEPMTALNPVKRVNQQLAEMYKIHRPDLSEKQMFNSVIKSLEEVGISDPDTRLSSYPHELSGGMKQRILIAMAFSLAPEILICDEPTTALDVTIQAQIIELIKELVKTNGTAVLFISHDLGVLGELADNIAIMYAGKIVEFVSPSKISSEPKHPYTRGLLDCLPMFASKPLTPLPTIRGLVSSPANYDQGCRFRERCDYSSKQCQNSPELSNQVACFHPLVEN